MTFEECIDYVNKHLEVRYATANPCYQMNRMIEPVGCVNHSFGVAQPDVEVLYRNMNQSGANWAVNAMLGNFHNGEGKILMTMKLNTRPWGCGSGRKGSWNNDHVQWEVCEPAGHTYNGGTMIGYDVKKNQAYFDRMWKMLVAWNVYVANAYGYGADAIHDHAESYQAGYGTNHADISHWFAKHGKSMDDLRKEVAVILKNKKQSGKKKEETETKKQKKITVKDLLPLTDEEVIKLVGPVCRKEHKKSGVFASVIMAQFILESGYGKTTELVKKSNNCFGMKKVLSNNTWANSTWKGDIVKVPTKEYENGKWITIYADFRAYDSINDSIADHTAYLLGAMNGSELRYKGLKEAKTPEAAIRIIKSGGYATDPNYVGKLVDIIKRWNLTKYDYVDEENASQPEKTPGDTTNFPKTPFMLLTYNYGIAIYKKTNNQSKVKGTTGKGLFTIVDVVNGYGLLKAYKEKRNGWVFLGDSANCKVQEYKEMVKVNIPNLNIRKGPGTNYEVTGETGIGIFTIVEVADGEGSDSGWGLLKAYQSDRNGWISLDYTTPA